MRRIAVIGGSLAGLRAAEALRRRGFDGQLTIVGEERRRPYARPPLSEALLAGTVGTEATTLRSGVEADWLLRRRATALDLDRRVVTLDGGDELPFDGLVIATGSRARAWPRLPELEGFHYLRGLDDALALRPAIAGRPRESSSGRASSGARWPRRCARRASR